ncbi:MAG: tetratricopeptide repeat protein [Candidatus Melainabacteria bacterium]|nr:tetratricopeptide repeat protein [Candidatus Melainabacteria bacterium]
MPIASTEMEISAARVRILPQRYSHFRQSVWQNYTEIGSRALSCGETSLAHRMFSEALIEARKEENIDYRLSVSLAHVGHSLLAQGNLAHAANTYLRALSIARNVTHAPKVFQIMLLETLADIRLCQGHLRLAKRHLSRAVSLREQFAANEKELLAKALLKLANVFSEMGDTDQAVSLSERSKQLRNP